MGSYCCVLSLILIVKRRTIMDTLIGFTLSTKHIVNVLSICI